FAFEALARANIPALNYANHAVWCDSPAGQAFARYAIRWRIHAVCKLMESTCHLNTQTATLAIHRPCGQHFCADIPQPIIDSHIG
ncbi:MAG TPA: hypothetical protein VMJ11_21695, partial [Paraburkholderia sp.]|uniref:hypothetical protein n=1 Tax=Paraburkholderia sp. TaxID=1926495 RepID=UPI002BC8CBFF